MSKKLKMKLLDGLYGVCRLDPTDKIPSWLNTEEFFTITKTSDELSIICNTNSIPNGIIYEKDWKIIKVEGPLDFSEIGILANISSTLATEKISIFAISTYDTDYILVQVAEIHNAIDALMKNGYDF
ncbi:ACT domain-containing protein [Cytobacillus sp. Hm23]